MAASFFEVFPVLKLNKGLADLLEEAVVEKITSSQIKKRIRVYVKSCRLLTYDQIRHIEYQIENQLFENTGVCVDVVDRYELSGQYTPERLMTIYFDSFEAELRDSSDLEANIFHKAKKEFSDPNRMTLTVEDNFITAARIEGIRDRLIRIFQDRFGFFVDISIAYEEKQKSRQAEVREPRKSSRASRRNDAERRTASASRTSNRTVAETLPESPLSLEQPRRLGPDESYRFSLSRQAYSQNGVPFIYAMKGKTIESIAAANNLFVKELIKFNDMRPGQRLEAGEIVYLQAKKKSTRKGLDKYIADSDGESLRNVSQRFGVKLSELCKKNNLSPSHVLKEGDTVILR